MFCCSCLKFEKVGMRRFKSKQVSGRGEKKILKEEEKCW